MIYVNGAGMTKFGEIWESSLLELAVSSSLQAVDDAGMQINDIDAVFVANMAASTLAGQDHLGSVVASALGINKLAFRVEGACASGSLAINAAAAYLNSGKIKNALVVGMEKMTDVNAGEVTKSLARAADDESEAFYGATFPSLYAMIAREYMRRYKLSRSDLALVSVKNHEHGSLNPLAQFRNLITVEDVLNSAIVAEPLGLLDCSPITDGAAAVVLSVSKKSEVILTASEVAVSTTSLHEREDLTTLDATVNASKAAYKEAGVTPQDIDFAEVHDCFSIAEILAYEDLGFIKKGKGINLIKNGDTYRSGKKPVNVSGGLKSCGHPVGATGLKQAAEAFWQLSGKAGERQLKRNLRYALTHNVGGSGGTAVINIYKQVN